jgi:WD40 repeat protein
MKRIHTISGKSDLKPNYFSIGTDSRTLISNAHNVGSRGEQYETVKFWDLVTGELVRIVDFRHDHVSVSAYEKWLLGVIYNADTIVRLNLETNEYALILGAAPRCLFNQRNTSSVTPLATSLYEPLVACGGQLQEIAAYNFIAEPISSDGYAMRLSAQKFSAESFSYNSSVIISPDSKFLLSQSLNRDFHHLWNMRTGELVRKFDSSSFGLAESLAVSGTGQLLACGLFSRQIQIWDVYMGEVRTSLRGDLPAVMSVSGKLLAYCNFEMSVVLWDVESNQEICTSSKSSAKIERLALSPDGEWLASYNQDQKIEIWSIF